MDRLNNPSMDFKVSLVPSQFIAKSFIDECSITAQIIANKYNNIYIGLSGGYDSEFVSKVFLENKIPFTPVITIYPGNEEEPKYALRFCLEHNLKPKILRLEAKEVLHIIYHDIIKRLNGIGINSVGCLTAARYAGDNGGVFIESEHIVGDGSDRIKDFKYYFSEWDFYSSVLTDTQIVSFFIYRPELTYAMVQEADESYEDWATFKNKVFNCPYRHKIKPRYPLDMHRVISNLLASRSSSPQYQYHIGDKTTTLQCLSI